MAIGAWGTVSAVMSVASLSCAGDESTSDGGEVLEGVGLAAIDEESSTAL